MAVIESVVTDHYAAYCADCIEAMRDLPTGKIHLSIYSPPFAVRNQAGAMYQYSSDPRDLSNCDDYAQFFSHYGFVVEEITRLTMPGRFTAVHCTDTPNGNTGGGNDCLTDFPGDIIRLHEAHGWRFVARHTIWKEPLWVRNRTMTKNLAHKTIVEDSSLAGVASADYLLMFRRAGNNPVPIAHPTGFSHYAGECPMPADILRFRNWKGKQTENRYSHWIWRRYASSVWDDIRMGRVLPFRDCRDPDDEKHVHPLQLDVIERAIQMRSNPGETVFTPFMGVGSEVYSAVTNGRRGIGVELKASYYRQACANLAHAVEQIGKTDEALRLFELDEELAGVESFEMEMAT